MDNHYLVHGILPGLDMPFSTNEIVSLCLAEPRCMQSRPNVQYDMPDSALWEPRWADVTILSENRNNFAMVKSL